MLDFSVTFIITIVNLVILFLILRKLLFKPVTKLMEDRTRRINDRIVQAEKDRQSARQLQEQFESRLTTAEGEAEAIIRAAREQAETEAGRITAGAKAEAERITAAARSRMETERLAAVAVFRAEAAALVVNAAGRLLKRELAGTEQLRYAAEVLDQSWSDHVSS
ncbi:MAG: F0F1 ATP synthase subunit B [Treponema sp.]|jgi:F-type H+-transporting ATPase subunit b|nr:F0F1 ATP synthase subunit B [Treponema sp.]